MSLRSPPTATNNEAASRLWRVLQAGAETAPPSRKRPILGPPMEERTAEQKEAAAKKRLDNAERMRIEAAELLKKTAERQRNTQEADAKKARMEQEPYGERARLLVSYAKNVIESAQFPAESNATGAKARAFLSKLLGRFTKCEIKQALYDRMLIEFAGTYSNLTGRVQLIEKLASEYDLNLKSLKDTLLIDSPALPVIKTERSNAADLKKITGCFASM